MNYCTLELFQSIWNNKYSKNQGTCIL